MKFKSQASSGRAASGAGFGAFGLTSSGSTLSYLAEPPNLSFIDDANVVVCFKNLSKKDGTTKSKALEDLRTYAQAHPYEQDGGVENPILEAWVSFYPRISIDTSRRVRELSHCVQYELLKSARKRMEKFIPKIVGSWLAGTYDRDRSVSRAATNGFKSFFDTDVKVNLFWKRCQVQILEYAQEAIKETPQSLSDVRKMTPEDVQDNYFRVIGSSISLVVNLLLKLSDDDTVQYQSKYDEFLSNNKQLWAFAACDDSFTRRAIDQLLEVCVDRQPTIIESDIELISHAFIAEALRVRQSSSALQLVNALSKATSKFPSIWTSSFKGKKSIPSSRLRNFIDKGSQGGPPTYWQSLAQLLSIIPSQVLATDVTSALGFLEGFRSSIGRREEPRLNASQAWSSYLDTVFLLHRETVQGTSRGWLLQESVYPIFEQYLHPTVENSKWTAGNGTLVIARAYKICSSAEGPESSKSFSDEWHRLADNLIQRFGTSLPEQSKDYEKSQSSVVAESRRWFSLLAAVLSVETSCSIKEPLIVPSRKILDTAVSVATNRNGKPYSAAATIEAALKLAPKFVGVDPASLSTIISFLENHLPRLFTSPSSTYLASVLFLLRSLPDQETTFENIWQSTIDGLLALPNSPDKIKAVTLLIPDDKISKNSQEDPALQDFLRDISIRSLIDREAVEAKSLFSAAITFHSMTTLTEKYLLEHIVGLVTPNDPSMDAALAALELISKKNPTLLRDDTKIHIDIITKLLALTELSESAYTSRAEKLKGVIEESEKTAGEESPILHVIRENLETANPLSLSIETLVQQAEATLVDSKDLKSVLPDFGRWKETLEPFLSPTPNPALGAMRPFAGAVFLVRSVHIERGPRPQRDLNGISIPLRMAMYTARLADKHLDSLTGAEKVDVLYLLGLTAQLVQDQIDLQEEGHLLASFSDSDVMIELQEFQDICNTGLSQIFDNAKDWLEEVAPAQEQHHTQVIQPLITKLLKDTHGIAPIAYHASRSLTTLLQRLINEHGWSNTFGETWLRHLDIVKANTTNVLGLISILLGLDDSLGSSKLVNNLCNRLISDAADVSGNSERTLALLVLLNATLSIYNDGELPVAQNRLVFAVKQILSLAESLQADDNRLSSEVCHTLQRLLPGIEDVYGKYWETALKFCVSIWESDNIHANTGDLSNERIPMIAMSLKLYTVLKNMKDANNDLEDALGELRDEITSGLVKLLKLPRFNRRRPTENLPLAFIDDLLSREVAKIPLGYFKDDLLEFYALVASDGQKVQSAAFDVLHRALPEAQQQISLDVLLETRDAKLPEELLSLLLDAPTLANFSDEVLAEFPTTIRGYLLSWQLVYGSFSTASFKVRNDYSRILKAENYIGPLLTFIFDVLGHSAGSPMGLANFDASKIRTYDMWQANDTETPEDDLHWLLINTYYLCLKYTPSLAKNWWLDCKSKQTRLAVESWTEKYFSPLVIQDTMDEVSKWSEDQEVSDDEKEIIIKLARNSREVFAGYEVDDMMMQIVIRLPAMYPLEGVRVEGVNRVAVTEKKWTSWLMITQGVITFSNGSITDGLNIFRKNVVGALKGQSECAICYSIISSDKRMPDKRCGTCKNLFHADCLFKWFSSSNQSTCPLCRNPFVYATGTSRTSRARDGTD